MSIVSAALSAFSSISKVVLSWLKKSERAEYRKAGTDEERVRTLEGNIDAAKRKKEVERETDRIGDTSLRSALGRFVPDDDSGRGDE